MFSQLVLGSDGWYDLPTTVDAYLTTLWRRGICVINGFPQLRSKIEAQEVSKKVVSQLWWKVFKHWVTFALHPPHATVPSRPVVVCGLTQVILG